MCIIGWAPSVFWGVLNLLSSHLSLHDVPTTSQLLSHLAFGFKKIKRVRGGIASWTAHDMRTTYGSPSNTRTCCGRHKRRFWDDRVFCFVQKMSERRAHSCKISYSASVPTGMKSLVCSVILLTCDGDIILLYFVPKHFLCSFSAWPLDVRLLWQCST